jgi:integral membrane sensor domain MASE1
LPVKIAALAVTYFITGKLGLQLGAVAGFATLVWPPSGISLAAVLLFGQRVWPGITIGALVVNLGRVHRSLSRSGLRLETRWKPCSARMRSAEFLGSGALWTG